jgi:hypothetical protein
MPYGVNQLVNMKTCYETGSGVDGNIFLAKSNSI